MLNAFLNICLCIESDCEFPEPELEQPEGHMLLTLPQDVRLRTLAAPMQPWVGLIGLGLAVGVAYFLAAKLSLALLAPDGVALFWPAAGVSAGVLIALGRDVQAPVVIGAVVAAIAANLTGDRNVWSAFSFALSSAGEALLAAWLIERYLGVDISLGRLRDLLGFLAVAVAAAAAAGVGGMVCHKLFHSLAGPAWTTWLHWFASDSIGMIIVAPLVIGVAQTLRQPPPRHEIIEGIAALAGLAVVTVIIVSLPPEPWQTMGFVALLFPTVLWIAARCHPVFAAAAAFIHSLTIVWAITFGVGHFGDPALSLGGRLLGAQVAIVGFALWAYLLAALFAERRQHETAIEESEARLQEALTAGAVTAFESNPRSGRTQRSENAAQILGLGPKQFLSSTEFLARVHGDDRRSFLARIRRVSIDCPSYSATFRFIRPDGRQVWLEETARAVFDKTGRLVRIKGVTRDISRRRRADERQDLLMAELDHRVKNVLARVAVVAMHTRQSNRTMDDFVRALDGRIQSMAAAHALLGQSRWYGVGLTDLTRRQLAPYTTDANTRISGPEVMLTAVQTQALAMVIHELVTNAAKYGALSSPAGRVSVGWDLTGAGSSVLTITWREVGGPPVATPVQCSYGSSLIRDLIPHELDGTVDLIFQAEGACCKIAIPLERK
jgi:PAS domain S-box-containing protein